jgi:hypothetical protein
MSFAFLLLANVSLASPTLSGIFTVLLEKRFAISFTE